MQVQEHDLNDMQMIKLKGKRTKRQRLPSPIRLTMSSTSWTNNSEEEEDMANCLILLARGQHHHYHQTHKVTEPKHNTNNISKNLGLYVYECKTCNRCFPSFHALGGHSVSHKKPKPNIAHDQKQRGVTRFVNGDDDDYNNPTKTNTTLTLQIPNNNNSNRALFGTKTTTRTSINTKCNKVHECSICGAEYRSGQALGGHMRRHRSILNTTSSTTTTTNYSMSGANNIGVSESPNESIEVKRPRNVLKLDLNLPAPEDDQREPKFKFKSKEKVIVFFGDCHH